MEANWIKDITVQDLDGNDVEISLYQRRIGGVFAMDFSFIDLVFDDDEIPVIPDPFGDIDEEVTKLQLIH